MGAFCVFGISLSVCQAAAAKKTPTFDLEEDRAIGPVEWAERRDELARQMFNQGGATREDQP